MATTLIVPGLHNSGPDHWQSHWERSDPSFRRVQQRCWSQPNLREWAGHLRGAIDRARGPVWIVAHSFGCLAVAYAAASRADRIAGALLVAPASPEKFDLAGYLPMEELPFPSALVASINDPWMRFTTATIWARRWGSQLISLGAAGHINAESGHGHWPEGRALLARLQEEFACLPRGPIDMPFRSATGLTRTKRRFHSKAIA